MAQVGSVERESKMSYHVTNNELKRIAEALEKIATALTQPNVYVVPRKASQEIYDHAPFWHHPDYKAPEVK